MQLVLPEQARICKEAERRLAELEVESTKLLQAHYADAITLDVLKAEQQRIPFAKAGGERRRAEAQASEQHLERQLDRVLNLVGQAQQHYLASPNQARRYLNQGVFKRIYIDDDEVIGSDLTLVFQRIMADDLGRSLTEERGKNQKHNVRTSGLYLVPDRADYLNTPETRDDRWPPGAGGSRLFASATSWVLSGEGLGAHPASASDHAIWPCLG
jgi:hypothetical protein